MSPRLSIRPLTRLSDRRLAELAAGGDERAFEALIGRHRVALERYCWRLGLPDHRAEDVLQQAFTRAWLSLRRGGDVGQPRPWLYRIVHNAALNAHRSARLRTHESIDAPVLGSLALATSDDGETRLQALEALREVAALPHLQRQAVVMTAIQGRSHEEAAGELGLTDGAVRGLLHRARTKLRAAAAALTPQGLAELLARMSSGGAEGGAVAAGGVLAKGVAVTALAGVLAGGAATQLEHSRSHAHRAAGPSAHVAATSALEIGTPAPRSDAASQAFAPGPGEERRAARTRDSRGRDRSSGRDRAEALRTGGGRGAARSGDRAERTVSSGEEGGRLSRSRSDGPPTRSDGSGTSDGGSSLGSGSSNSSHIASDGVPTSDGRGTGEGSGAGTVSGGGESSGGPTSPATAALTSAQDGQTTTDGGATVSSSGASPGS
jgi:RNA polymerase sigma factor (sigma-70 family)